MHSIFTTTLAGLYTFVELTDTTETPFPEDKSAPARTSAQKSEGEIYWEQQVTKPVPKKKRSWFSLFARKAGCKSVIARVVRKFLS